MLFSPLLDYFSKDIEEKFSIPSDVTRLFLETGTDRLPFAFIRIYQQYFNLPSFREILDEDELEDYLLDEDRTPTTLHEYEYMIRDESFLDEGFEKGALIEIEPDWDDLDGFKALEFNEEILFAKVTQLPTGDISLEFANDYFGEITLPESAINHIRVLGEVINYYTP